jgi:hypothetical protein
MCPALVFRAALFLLLVPADRPPAPVIRLALAQLHACSAELDQLPLMACPPGPLYGPGVEEGKLRKELGVGMGLDFPPFRLLCGFHFQVQILSLSSKSLLTSASLACCGFNGSHMTLFPTGSFLSLCYFLPAQKTPMHPLKPNSHCLLWAASFLGSCLWNPTALGDSLVWNLFLLCLMHYSWI